MPTTLTPEDLDAIERRIASIFRAPAPAVQGSDAPPATHIEWELQKRLNRVLAFTIGVGEEVTGSRRELAALKRTFENLLTYLKDRYVHVPEPRQWRHVLNKDEAVTYTGHATAAEFKRWCTKWRVTQRARGRYSKQDLDLAIDREGGYRYTPLHITHRWETR